MTTKHTGGTAFPITRLARCSAGLIKSLEHTTMAAETEAKEVDERNAVIAVLRTQNRALVKEMRHIAGISNGQVKRVADQALAAQAEGGV